MTLFSDLLAREVHTHEAAPGVVFVTGWDDRIQVQVCWIVTPLISAENVDLLFDCAGVFILNHNGPTLDWLVGVAYIVMDGLAKEDFNYDDPDPLPITPLDYASAVREHEAQS